MRRKMSQIPHELIRDVQIRTRAAAGLPDYNPSDPTLPALPSLSAAIASAPGPGLRCNNCKAMLLRGSQSIVCVYCGMGPHYDAVPDPLCFTSTTGYQWLLRSLRLDGSEMVDLENKGDQDQGNRSPKALTRLSDFLNFKISWPAESEKKEETSFSGKQPEESRRSLSLPGIAPDKFFKSKTNILSDMSTEQTLTPNQFGTADKKDVASLDNQNLFQKTQSSEQANSPSKHGISEAFAEWDAEFQSADFQNQHSGDKSSEQFADSGNKFQDPVSLDHSTGLEVDLSAEIDSVFGPRKDLNDGKPKDNQAVAPAFGDWDSDDMWNNLSSNKSNFSSGLDATTIITRNDQEDDHRLEYSEDLSTEIDSVFGPGKDLNDGKPKDNQAVAPALGDWDSDDMWNVLSSNKSNFSNGLDAATISTKNDQEDNHRLEYSKDLSTSGDLFQDFQSHTNYPDMNENKTNIEEHKTDDEDSFDDWNDFTGSTSSQVPSLNVWPGDDHKVSTSDQKSSEIDLFSFNNNVEGDFSGFSQSNQLSTSTSNNNVLTEATAAEIPASNWSSDVRSPSHEPGEAANNGDAFESSAKDDDVKMLLSQMHDLSFMLEDNLSIPSSSNDHNSSIKD